jgi:hypothetical protein
VLRASFALLALGVVSACGQDAPGPAGAAGVDGGHRLRLEQTYEAGPQGQLFIEGALAEVVLRPADQDEEGQRVVRGSPQGALVVEDLPAGRYVIEPALRSCQGNCEQGLDPRSGGCRAEVRVPEDAVVQVRYVVTQPCTTTVGAPSR